MTDQLDLFGAAPAASVERFNGLPVVKGPGVLLEIVEALPAGQAGTLGEAIAQTRAAMTTKDAERCPCCRQLVKLYCRKLNASQARALLWLVREAGPDRQWVNTSRDAPRFIVKTNQLGTVAYWGLVEPQQNEDKAKRTSGVWRPTPAGVDFAMGRTSIPSHCYCYNQTCWGFWKPRVTIQKALGERFDYQKLMEGEDHA